MKSELTATAPAAFSDDAEKNRAEKAGAPTNEPYSPTEVVQVIKANAKLLVVGSALAGLIAFGIASLLPKSYTSVIYLSVDEAEARAADALMRSTPVIDRVLAEYTPPEASLDARREHIEKHRQIVVAPGETARTSKLFRMEYSDGDPAVAQKVNSLLTLAWLDSTKPAPDKRAAIEAELERAEAQAKAIADLIERLEKEAPSLIVAQSRQGEIATPILQLIAKRDENLANILKLRDSLKGLSHDVIFGASSLPDRPSWPKRGVIVISTIVATGLLLLVFVFLRRLRLDSLKSYRGT